MIKFKKRPDRNNGWESYISTSHPKFKDIYKWCHTNFGPLGKRWDQHGGWFYIWYDEDMTLFKLIWE